MLDPQTEKVPNDLIGEHSQAKDDHVHTLKLADEALIKATEAIREARERLNNAIQRYEERAHGPIKRL